MRAGVGWMTTVVVACLALPSTVEGQPLAANKSKFVGNVISNGNGIRPNFKNYWNQVTPENAGKWGSVQSASGSYNFGQLDNMYNYAIANGFAFKEHTLIWGNQQPAFLSGLDSAGQYAEIAQWIDTTGKRYPAAEFCDVVNEPLHAVPIYKNALGGDGATGWDWVIKAFELARASWPNTQLILNEYSVINDGTANANFLVIINLLKDRGLIDGIGVQGHNFEVAAGASTTTLYNNLSNLAATGLPIYISEFDINRSDDAQQLSAYQSVFPTLYEHPGVAGITLWGYVEYDIWQTFAFLLTERYAERPAMEWLRTYLASPFRPVSLAPNSLAVIARNPTLVWSSPDSADAFHVQISTSSVFATTLIDSVTGDTTLALEPLDANTRYYWRVKAINGSGESFFSSTATFMTGGEIATGVEASSVPRQAALYQNFPNPFNPATHIQYELTRRSHVTLEVCDLLGRVVATLVNSERSEGLHQTLFDASHLPAGTYVCRLQTADGVVTSKLVLVK